MPLPSIASRCAHTEVDASLADVGITLPGGVRLSPTDPTQTRRGTSVALMVQLNTALAPLQPLFNLIAVVFSIKDTFDAVKSLNPFSIGEAIAKLVTHIEKLAALLPPVSVPLLVRDAVDALILFLTSLRDDLTLLAAQKVSIDAAVTSAATNDSPELAEVAECAQENLEAEMTALGNSMAAPMRLVAVINLLGNLVGLNPVPVSGSIGVDPVPALTTINAVLAALTTVRAAIPV